MREKDSLAVYLHELNQQVQTYLVDLDELAAQASLNNRDYYAVERLVQVLIEACIGIAKHWLKFLKHPVPNDAYKTFAQLAKNGLIEEADLVLWRKIIGLRNALVHDYLNLDRAIVQTVLREKHYLFLADFVKRATALIAKAG